MPAGQKGVIFVEDTVNKLVEARNRAWSAAKEIMDRAADEGRAPSAEEREATDKAFADIDAIDAQVKGLTERARSSREAEAARGEWEKIVAPDTIEARDADAWNAFDAFLRGNGPRHMDMDFRQVAAEKRALRAGATGQEFRVLAKSPAALGGNLIPTSFVRELYDYLEVYSGMRRTNATIVTTTGGENLEFPKVVSGGTAAGVNEGAVIGSADPTFGKMTLGAFKFGQLLQYSNELAQDSGVDLLGFAARDFGRALGRVTDNKYVLGAGSTEPTGIMTVAGTGVTGGTGVGGAPTFDNLITLLYSVNEEYRANNAQWLMRDATAGVIRRLKDNDGQYLWQPGLQVGQPDRLLGFEVVSDPNVAAIGSNALSLAFGDFSAFYIRDVGSVRIERSDDFAFNTDLVTWRALLRTDSNLIDLTGAVKAFQGGTQN
jgi:HK97 family phage major capsid protein